MTMITRIGFCEKCAKEHRPKTGQLFMAFGGTSDNFKSVLSTHGARKGFTPHLYDFERLIGDTVYFKKLCGMMDCGAYLATFKGENYIYLHEELWVDGYMPLKDWNSLVLFKDTGFRI